LGRARVDRDDDAVFVDEGEGRGAVVGLDVIDNLALEIIVLCDRVRGGGVVTVRSRGRRSNGKGGNPRNKFDVARLGASGVIAGDGWRRTFSTWGSLKFCAWTSLWISRALCGRMGRGSQRSVGQREEGRWRNGCHHPHGFVFEISAVRGAGRWAHYSQVRLYPVRRALRRIQHRVIELESRHRDRLPRRVYLTTELSFAPKPGDE